MASKLQTFHVKDWTEGLNTSSDETLLNPKELSIAENVIFNTSGSRKTRGGFKLWNYVATGVSRASSNKTRTIIVTLNSGITINALDYIGVWTDGSYNSDYDIKKIQVDSITPAGGSNYTIVYTMDSNLTETTTADTNLRVCLFLNEKVIGLKDFWYFSAGSKIQKRVIVTSDGNFYQVSSAGSMTPISLAGGVSFNTPLAHADFAVLGNKLIISFDQIGNTPVVWTGTGTIRDMINYNYDGSDVSATNPVPDFEYMQVWSGRLWTNDKVDPDKLHYSDIQEPERMNGEGDSGAFLVDPGDDDVSGISAILPPMKGRLPFAKRNKLFQVVGEPPLAAVVKISDGIGSASHFGSSAIDQDDIFFVSRKGFHSFSATGNFGDFGGTFISNKIQKEFNELVLGNMAEIRSVYIPSINSVVWAVNGSGSSDNDRLYMYNIIPEQPAAWYVWRSDEEELSFTALELFDETNVKALYVGTADGLVLKYDDDADYDLVRSDLNMRIKTGIIYPDENIATIKGFKRISLLYKVEREDIAFSIKFKIDNYDTQVLNITRDVESDLLGSTFVLGSSTLGVVKILVPDPVDVDGYGHGCSIEINAASQPLELYGYAIDYEPAGESPERNS